MARGSMRPACLRDNPFALSIERDQSTQSRVRYSQKASPAYGP